MRAGDTTILLATAACLLILLAALTPPPAGADAPPAIEWSRTYGGPEDDIGYSVQITGDGGYVIVGETDSAPDSGAYLIRTDSTGNLLWSHTYGGSGLSVQITEDGGYIIAGAISKPDASADVYLIRTDSEGNHLWNKTYGGPDTDVGRSVRVAGDSGYVVAGITKSFGSGGWDVYLLRTDSEGRLLWNKTYGGPDDDMGRSVQVTSDGGCIVAGSTKSYGSGKSDVYLVKTDSEGKMLWSKTFGGSKADRGNSVIIADDGGYVVAGCHVILGEGGAAGGSDAYLIKTDQEGDLIWKRTYGEEKDETGGSINEEGYSVQATRDGGYVVVGDVYLGLNRDIFIVKTDSEGHEIWSANYGGPLADVGNSVQVTGDGGCIIAGRTDRDSPNVFDVYLVKISPLPSVGPESGAGEGVPIYLYAVPIALLAIVTAWFLQKRRNPSASKTRLNP